MGVLKTHISMAQHIFRLRVALGSVPLLAFTLHVVVFSLRLAFALSLAATEDSIFLLGTCNCCVFLANADELWIARNRLLCCSAAFSRVLFRPSTIGKKAQPTATTRRR